MHFFHRHRQQPQQHRPPFRAGPPAVRQGPAGSLGLTRTQSTRPGRKGRHVPSGHGRSSHARPARLGPGRDPSPGPGRLTTRTDSARELESLSAGAQGDSMPVRMLCSESEIHSRHCLSWSDSEPECRMNLLLRLTKSRRRRESRVRGGRGGRGPSVSESESRHRSSAIGPGPGRQASTDSVGVRPGGPGSCISLSHGLGSGSDWRHPAAPQAGRSRGGPGT
jgi:hypothetical protein